MLSAAILAFALPIGNAAAATNFTVSTTSDTSASGGACGNTAIKTAPSPLSLREATCLANNVGGEVNITVPAGEYKLANGELIPAIKVGQTVNYIGAGAASTIVNAQGLNRVMNYDSTVAGGIAGKVSGLTITGGSDGTFGGAGIIAGSGNTEPGDELTLESVVVKGNEANPGKPTVTNNPGGGVVMANGRLVVINCTFTENKSNGSKGSALAIVNNTIDTGPQGLKIVGSTFTRNESANGFANTNPGGGAVLLADSAGTNEITESKFIGNEVNSATEGGAIGAAIFRERKAPTTITRSTFSENKVSSPKGGTVAYSAVASTHPESSITLHYNRFHGNNTSTAIGGTGTWNATDNWWGCNTGANTSGCDGAAGGITTTPYLKLNASASPTTLAGPNATATLQGDFLHDSAGTAISEANLAAFAGEPLTWSDPKPAGATINGHASPETTTTNIASGKATATYNSQSTSGAGHAVVAFDNASVTIPLTVDQKPAITQNPSDQHVTPGSTATFTAAASGEPTPGVQWQQDTGSGFTNISGATSTTYSFTAAQGETGYKFRAVFTNTIEGTPYTATTTAATLFVGKATTSLSTNATSTTIGGAIKDTATLSGGFSPTGTITFKAYGPNDSTCSGAVAYTKSQTVTANGSYESEGFTPTEAGAYRWVVEYSGDGNNEAATSACNSSNETSTVSKFTTSLSSTATGSSFPGAIEDTATLSGGSSPTGTITFKVFGPNDGTCTGTVAYTKTQTVSGNGSYESEEFTPTGAGAYRWTVKYSGDAENEAATSGCNASNETSNVAKAAPSLATEATDGQAATTAIHDTATLSDGVGATGTITFKAYGPNDATCSNAAAFTDTESVSGNSAVMSADFEADEAGAYRWTAEYSGDSNNEIATSGCNAAEETSNVAKAAPTLTTSATSATLGGGIEDTATLTGGSSPGGTVTFNLYGPDDATCSGLPAYTHTGTVSGNEAASSSFTPTVAGAYRWTAQYSGDANNEGTSSGCNAAGETSNVGKLSPSISTEASDAAVGSPIHDKATLTGGASPTGTITFKAYGPNATVCTGTPAFTVGKTVSGAGNYESGDFTPAGAGTYLWVAEYSGDANNAAVTSACNAEHETSTVAKATPTLSTAAQGGNAGFQAIEDISNLENGFSPTGTITFKVYGPNATTCTGTPAYTHTATVVGNGHNTSDQYLTNLAGEYLWTAEYSGDANNEGASEGCNAPGEESIVHQATPQLRTSASADGNAGSPIHDTAELSFAAAPTGTVTFKAYGPNDATCSGAPAFTSAKTVTGSEPESAPFTPTVVGTYRWTAEYSGDDNNEGASEGCNAPEETSTVGKATPNLATQATDAAFGGAIHDTATLTGGVGATGTITFKAYGPDTACSGLPVFSATLNVEGEGNYASGDFTPTQSGAYRWIASYSGDANNKAVAGACGNASEISTVSAPPTPPAPPAISPCPATSPSVTPFEPPKKTVNGPVPGVRARIAVARPSQLSVTATLKYRRGGKTHSVGLGTAALYDGGSANLKLALPTKLANALPVGTKVHLTLAIAAYPAGAEACSAQPEPSTQHLRTKVVRVLVD